MVSVGCVVIIETSLITKIEIVNAAVIATKAIHMSRLQRSSSQARQKQFTI